MEPILNAPCARFNLEPIQEIDGKLGLKSARQLQAKPCSARLQASIWLSQRCPPEGGRYKSIRNPTSHICSAGWRQGMSLKMKGLHRRNRGAEEEAAIPTVTRGRNSLCRLIRQRRAAAIPSPELSR